jgi:hypothetical protein
MNRAACFFDGCEISLIGDVEVLDRDRRALKLAYALEASIKGRRTAVRSSSASLRLSQAGEIPSLDGLRQ